MRYTQADREFSQAIFPSLVLPLIRARIISREDAGDLSKVREIVFRRRKFAIKRMRWGVALELTFVAEAEAAWQSGRKEVAIVLLATALEQALNGVLRSLIETAGIDAEHATELIRTHNTAPKLTWLFEMFAHARLPAALRRRVQ